MLEVRSVARPINNLDQTILFQANDYVVEFLRILNSLLVKMMAHSNIFLSQSIKTSNLSSPTKESERV